jgi:hypothetical protein
LLAPARNFPPESESAGGYQQWFSDDEELFIMRRVFLFGLIVLLSAPALASDAELRRLQSILATLNQELTATYQQFQMADQARHAVLQSLYAPRPGLDTRSYDQLTDDREQATQQERALTEQMNRLLTKAQEIEKQMSPVLERVYQLIPNSAESTSLPSPPPPPPPPRTSGPPETGWVLQ